MNSRMSSLKGKFKKFIKEGAFFCTRGQLLNYATLLYDVPTVYPDRGPGRTLKVYEGDTFIVSYPRSGNTWMRFLVGNLANPDADVNYANIEKIAPDIYLTPESFLRKMARPRVLKSHEAFDPRYKKLIYVVRNPVDVALSLFHTLKRTNSKFKYSFQQFVTLYLEGEFDAWFGSWDQHVNSWIHHQTHSNSIHLVRYEELYSDPHAALTSVAKFLKYSVDEAAVRQAVERSSKGEMTRLYKSTGELIQRDIGKGNAGFLMPSEVERDVEIAETDLRRLIDRYSSTMQLLGYSTDGVAARSGFQK